MRANQLTLTREECEKAIEMRRKGVKVNAIAKYFLVGEATVVRYMRHHGLYEEWRKAISGTVSKPNVGNTREIPFFWLYHRRYNWGWTYQQIADDFGCDARKVRHAMQKHGFLGSDEDKERERIGMKPTAEVLQQEYIVKNRRVIDLAAEYGVSTSKVNRWLKKDGISKRKGRPDDDELYLDYVVEEMDVRDMAKKYGVCRETVYKWAQDAEIKRRHEVTVHECLAALREYERGHSTQEQMAKDVGVSLSTMRRYINRGRKIKAELEKKGMVTV